MVDRRFAPEWREVALWGRSPLASHIFTEYEPAGATPEHELLVRKGRSVELVDCARIVRARTDGTAAAGSGHWPVALRIRLEPVPGRRLGRTDIVVPETDAVLASVGVRGDAPGIAMDGLVALDVPLPFPEEEGGLDGALWQAGVPALQLCLVRLIDPEGERIATIPILDP